MPRSKSDNIARAIFVPRIIRTTNSNSHLSAHCRAVVKTLQKHLKRAEAGKIHGMCLTWANDDQTYDGEAVGSYEEYPSEAIAPLEVLKLKITRRALDEQ